MRPGDDLTYTPTYICVAVDNAILGVYLHHGGRPSIVGAVLVRRYRTALDALRLLMLGDLSTLGPDTDATVAYARDAGSVMRPPFVLGSYEELFRRTYRDSVRYVYLLHGDRWWYSGDMKTWRAVPRQ